MQQQNESRMDLFPANLKTARTKRKITQESLALSLGHTGYQTISRYERGEREPDGRTIIGIASTLDVSSDWLLKGTINRNYPYGLQSALRMLKKQPSDIAEKLKLPLPFVQAIVDGEIGPSDEMYDRMLEEGLGVKSNRNIRDEVDAEVKKQNESSSRESKLAGPPPDGYQVAPQEERVEKLRTQLDTCYERYFDLKERFDSLEREYEKLRKAGS